MPFIETKTSVTISAEKETILKKKLGEAITCIPGKDESWLMLSFQDNIHMWFRGENGPMAMVEVKIFGSADKKYYEKMTNVVCSVFNQELGIPKDKVYVKYEEVDNWGWNGDNF